MEVKIGLQNTPRELVLESDQSPAAIEAAVTAAISRQDGVLTLVDEKGRRLIVAVEKLAYVEIAEAAPLRVGFGR